MSDASLSFISYMTSVDACMMYVAAKFPTEGMRSFSVDGEGRFEILYDKEQRANASHFLEGWSGILSDVSVKIGKIVRGVILVKPVSIQIEAGCITAQIKKSVISLDVSVTGIKAVSKTQAAVMTKCGVLPEMSQNISQEVIMFTKLEWI